MTLSSIFNALGDIFLWTFQIFEIIGNSFNYMLIVLGFIGFFIWMRMQAKYNQEAEKQSESDQIIDRK